MVVSSVALALMTGASAGDMAEFGVTLGSGLAYVPAEVVLAGLALVIYGIRPRLFWIAWAGFAAMTFITFVGKGPKFPRWVRDLSPTTHVGNPPTGTVQNGALIEMSAVAAILVAIGFVGFRRRRVPQNRRVGNPRPERLGEAR